MLCMSEPLLAQSSLRTHKPICTTAGRVNNQQKEKRPEDSSHLDYQMVTQAVRARRYKH